jgi:hypothetical protein
MKIVIRSIKKDSPSDKNYIDYSLPNLLEWQALLKDTLYSHPFLLQENLHLPNININVDVLVGGKIFILQSNNINYEVASIKYEDYLVNNNCPICLLLHFAVYQGVFPEELNKYFPPGETIDDHYEEKKRKEFASMQLNRQKVKMIILHETAHLIDAIDPQFHLLVEKLIEMRQDAPLYYYFMELWNCYINSRLRRMTKLEFNMPTIIESKQSAKKVMIDVWDSNQQYSVDQLYDLAKIIKIEFNKK